jgi:hypothetical protein
MFAMINKTLTNYLKNSKKNNNKIFKKQPKIGKGQEQVFLQRRHTNGQEKTKWCSSIIIKEL